MDNDDVIELRTGDSSGILHVAAEEMQRFGPELLTSMMTYSEKVQNEGILLGLRTDSVLDGGLPYGLLLTSVFTSDMSFAKLNVPVIPLLALTEEYGMHCRECEGIDGGPGWIAYILWAAMRLPHSRQCIPYSSVSARSGMTGTFSLA